MLPRHLHQGLQNILAPVPPAFLIRPLPHLPLGNLSPVVSPGSPLHLSYRHRAAASCLSATVSSPASCRTASVGVRLSIPDIILAALSWVRSSLSLLVLEIQGPHAGAAYSSNIDRSVDETRCPRDQPKSASASRIRRLFLGASLLVMLSCLSEVPPKNSSICSGGNCLIAYLYVLVSPRLCRISAKKACLSFLIVQLQHPSSTPLISSACNACSFLFYIYVLHTKFTAHATFRHSEHCLWINLVRSMHLTEFTTNPTTTDCTRVFPKVTTESHSLRRGSSSLRCLPSGLFFPLQLCTC